MSAWSRIKELRNTLIVAGIVTLLLCQRHLGYMVFFEILILIPWLLGSLWKIIKNPQIRSLQATKISIWLLSVVIIIGSHYSLASRTRAHAQEIVDAITAYHTAHGRYPEPKDLQSIGYTEDKIRSMVGGLGGYFIEGGQPSFFYASTYIIFETDNYDFSKREWVHRD